MKQVVDANGLVLGSFDGEFVLNGTGSPIYRIDINEVYSTDIACKFLGELEGNSAIGLSGQILFTIVAKIKDSHILAYQP